MPTADVSTVPVVTTSSPPSALAPASVYAVPSSTATVLAPCLCVTLPASVAGVNGGPSLARSVQPPDTHVTAWQLALRRQAALAAASSKVVWSPPANDRLKKPGYSDHDPTRVTTGFVVSLHVGAARGPGRARAQHMSARGRVRAARDGWHRRKGRRKRVAAVALATRKQASKRRTCADDPVVSVVVSGGVAVVVRNGHAVYAAAGRDVGPRTAVSVKMVWALGAGVQVQGRRRHRRRRRALVFGNGHLAGGAVVCTRLHGSRGDVPGQVEVVPGVARPAVAVHAAVRQVHGVAVIADGVVRLARGRCAVTMAGAHNT